MITVPMKADWIFKNTLFLIFTAAPSLTCIDEFLSMRSCIAGTTQGNRVSKTKLEGTQTGRKNSQLLLVLFTNSLEIWCSQDFHVPVRIRYFHVPSPLVAGESALLSCHYELQANETLYAVKWYKNMGEFFRYVPRADPQFKTLSQPGIHVDEARSNHREVYLRNMGLNSLGNYTCQVSTDAPYFRCVQSTRHLDVVVPPADGPMLQIEEKNSDFQLGDNVSIQCTSGKGKPAPQLAWYINDRPAESASKEREVVVYPDSMESSSLLLRFHLKPEVFKKGKVVLKCVATLHQLEAAATKEILAEYFFIYEDSTVQRNIGTRHAESMKSLVWLTSLSLLFYYTSSSVTAV